MGVVAGLAGAALMIGGSAMAAGKKVRVPTFNRVNVEEQQKAAITGNIAALESASELAKKTTAAEQSQLEAQLRRAIPNYDQLVSQAGKNIGAALQGQISPEVSAQIQRSTAGRALAGGFGGGTGFGRALTARDLGLTGMQIQSQGLAQAQNFIQQQRAFGMVQPFSVSSMFISPTQRINLALQENQSQYNRDMAAAQVAAQPDPMMAAIGGSLSNIGGIALGGAMGGMGGKGGGGGGGFTINMGGGGYGIGGGSSYYPQGVSGGYNPYGQNPYGGYGGL